MSHHVEPGTILFKFLAITALVGVCYGGFGLIGSLVGLLLSELGIAVEPVTVGMLCAVVFGTIGLVAGICLTAQPPAAGRASRRRGQR